VLRCFNNNNEVGINIYEDQSFTTYELTDNVSKSDIALDISIPHLKIPLTSFIKKFIVNEEKEKFLISTSLISEQEMQVITHLRKQNLKSITIHFGNDYKIKKNRINGNGTDSWGGCQRDNANIGFEQLYGYRNTYPRRQISFFYTYKKKVYGLPFWGRAGEGGFKQQTPNAKRQTPNIKFLSLSNLVQKTSTYQVTFNTHRIPCQ
jgi:hypothetical protein